MHARKTTDCAHFFVSYTKSDVAWARRIRTWLIDAGYVVIMQEPDFVPGRNFVSLMDDALKQAQWVVAVLSPTYLKRGLPAAEWTSAFLGDRLIPVRVVDFSPPGLLAPIIYINMVGKRGPSAQRFFIEQIRHVLGRANRIPSSEEVEAMLAEPDSRPRQTAVGNCNIQAGGDVTVFHAHRVVRRTGRPAPRPEFISRAQALEVRKLVQEIAQTESPTSLKRALQKWYGVIYNRYDVVSYLEIPTSKAEDVISWLRQNLARVRSRSHPRGTNTWRKGQLTSIWARTREIGMSKPQVHELARSVLNLPATPTSLRNLTDTQLASLYRHVFALPRRTRDD